VGIVLYEAIRQLNIQLDDRLASGPAEKDTAV
jgi:hypothetical protein